ncbi:LacI family DNA-binding transcriptional regulator [Nocardioides bruguierae]|uniref:LacI family transcriptional regulator n=1 Tax=Nocardioides bruguierae TaxID=2945102 RepID=A0A9X2D8E2_9ACTN|nr:LacI family DNA-binding transcriptional regulator [Nocardioides bruguierae]MCM0620944.1 LacI family transcriptional regulator [Nocardioides bruguierae]
MEELAESNGRRSVRMADVAAHAGVALGTVSHVLNHPEKVSPHTLERVRRSIDELGFVPNSRARALAAGTSSMIAFIVIDLGNSFFLDMARGAELEAQERGLNLVLANCDMNTDKELVYLSLFDAERMAGVLIAPLPSSADDQWRLQEWQSDVVALNVDASGRGCCVTTDDELGGYLAAQHLIEAGCRRLLFTGGPFSLLPIADRYRGAQRAVAEADGVSLELLRTLQTKPADGRKVGDALAARAADARPDGVLAATDLIAFGIIEALGVQGVSVPDDVKVIGYDNNRQAWESTVPISTMAQPGEEMGRHAVRLLVDEIRNPGSHEHEHVRLTPTLIARESTGT